MADLLFCSLRKIWVTNLPEERVRQALIEKMIYTLGFPRECLAIEKSLSELPHILPHHSLPKRRADLIVFAKNLHPNHLLYPLLLIECKSIPLTQNTLRQIIGYNQYVGAYFIATVNQTHEYIGCYEVNSQDFFFQEGLPSYSSLLSRIKN